MLQFWSDPNFASSGRWNNWGVLTSSFFQHPERLVFGVGYKSLATTSLFGKKVLADNAYLSALMETGIVGLGAFLTFQFVLLRTLHEKIKIPSPIRQSHRVLEGPTSAGTATPGQFSKDHAERQAAATLHPFVDGRNLSPGNPCRDESNSALIPNFYAQFMFAFWIGELVQMLTGDLFTFWRNLILFFTVMALAITKQTGPGITHEQVEATSTVGSVQQIVRTKRIIL